MKKKLGRPKSEPTKVISFRVPEKLSADAIAAIRRFINSIIP